MTPFLMWATDRRRTMHSGYFRNRGSLHRTLGGMRFLFQVARRPQQLESRWSRQHRRKNTPCMNLMSELTNGKRTTSPVLVLVWVTMPLTYASPTEASRFVIVTGSASMGSNAAGPNTW